MNHSLYVSFLQNIYIKVVSVWILQKIIFVGLLLVALVNGQSWREAIGYWDAAWYIQIAETGFTTASLVKPSTIAFAPLFPWLGRLAGMLVPDMLLAMTLLANFAGVAGLLLLVVVLKKYYDEKFVLQVIILIIFSPVGFVFSLPYSEGIFFLLGSLFFVLLERKLLWAACVLSILPLARTAGFFLGIPLLQQMHNARISFLKRFGMIAVAGLGTIGWLWFNWTKFGHPLFFLTAHAAWHRNFALFPLAFGYQLEFFIRHFGAWTNFMTWPEWIILVLPYFIDTLLVLFMVSLTILYYNKLPNIFKYYTLAYVIWGVSFPPYNPLQINGVPVPTLSMLRFIALCFPVYILLVLQNREKFSRLLNISVTLHIFYLAMFLNGYYVP